MSYYETWIALLGIETVLLGFQTSISLRSGFLESLKVVHFLLSSLSHRKYGGETVSGPA